MNIQIKTNQTESIEDFLQSNGFFCEKVLEKTFKVCREEVSDFPVFIHKNGSVLHFEVEIGNVNQIANEKRNNLYLELLKLNIEILPVSLGIDYNKDENEFKIVLLESREILNLDDNEIISVFEALEIATVKVLSLLSKTYIN